MLQKQEIKRVLGYEDLEIVESASWEGEGSSAFKNLDG
jgi:hypothetical protein